MVLRSLWDALGFTGLSRSKKEHHDTVSDAREWFHEGNDDFEEVCEMAGLDSRKIRSAALRLIAAKQSGDHSNVPDFWREAFRRGRMPSYTAFESEIETLLQSGEIKA